MKIDISRLKKIIGETFKELKIEKFALLGQGKSGIICLVNNETVFKIPLQREGDIADWQKNEAVVLRFLEGKTDIEIPKILHTAFSECGLYIIGETMLSGTTFSYELCDTFDRATRNDILRQLGKITRNLHEAGGNDSSWHDTPETSEDLINEFNENFSVDVRKLFSREDVDKIEAIAECYRDLSARHPVKPVLCHNDLHFFNLMFDTESKKITGVLDFGCAGYSEPARDFHYYFDAKHVLEGYGEIGDEFFSYRQKFHALSHLLNNLSAQTAEKQRETLGYIDKYIFRSDSR